MIKSVGSQNSRKRWPRTTAVPSRPGIVILEPGSISVERSEHACAILASRLLSLSTPAFKVLRIEHACFSGDFMRVGWRRLVMSLDP